MRFIAAAFWRIPARFLNEYVGINAARAAPTYHVGILGWDKSGSLIFILFNRRERLPSH